MFTVSFTDLECDTSAATSNSASTISHVVDCFSIKFSDTLSQDYLYFVMFNKSVSIFKYTTSVMVRSADFEDTTSADDSSTAAFILCLVDCFSDSLLLCDQACAFFYPFSLLIPALFILCPCPTEKALSVPFTNSELITSADGSSFAASVSILNGIFCTLDSSELEQQYRTTEPAELEPSDDIISRINCST